MTSSYLRNSQLHAESLVRECIHEIYVLIYHIYYCEQIFYLYQIHLVYQEGMV